MVDLHQPASRTKDHRYGEPWPKGLPTGGGDRNDIVGIFGREAAIDRYERMRRRRGRAVADAVHDIAERAPEQMPPDEAWAWAEGIYDERELAAAAGTGYDPAAEHAFLPYYDDDTET